MKNLKLAILAGALTSVAAVALAQSNKAPAPQQNAPETNQAAPNRSQRHSPMEWLDANKDGSIGQDEFVSNQRLKEADANGDGTLSTDELVAMAQKMEAQRQAERLTRRFDMDGDGKVTIAEIEKQQAKRFAMLDRNDDGKLEGNELRHGDRHNGKRHKGDREHHRHGGHNKRPDQNRL